MVQAVAFILSEIELEDKSNVIADVVVEKLTAQLDVAWQEVAKVTQGLKGTVLEVVVAEKTQLKESLGDMLEGIRSAAQGGQ